MAVRPAARVTRPALYRLWRIHTLIRSGACPPVPQIARELEVHPRTIERDIEYLRDVFGAPIAFDHATRSYVYTDPSFELPPVRLSEGEIAALLVAARLLADHEQTPLGPIARRALERLAQMLPHELMVSAETLDQALVLAPRPRPVDEDVVRRRFEVVMQGILHRKRLRIVYHAPSTGQTTEREIDPYTLYHAGGCWYVIAHCHLRRGIRLFALQRIAEVTITEQPFERPADYAPAAVMQDAWRVYRGVEGVEVRLRFSPEVAALVAERRWHPSQRLVFTRGRCCPSSTTSPTCTRPKSPYRWPFGPRPRALSSWKRESARRAGMLSPSRGCWPGSYPTSSASWTYPTTPPTTISTATWRCPEACGIRRKAPCQEDATSRWREWPLMVVLILERVPATVRGLLSRWMLEPRAGVFVGTPPARVRDKLWDQVSKRLRGGGCLLIHSAATEQGFLMRSSGDPGRMIESFEGLQLIRIPSADADESNDAPPDVQADR